jgi:peptidoglycan/LPS O-acetylase OafA/YrhL
MKRLVWLDVAKGLAILVVVYFHFFRTYFEHGVMPPPDWSDLSAALATLPGWAWVKISNLGFHAVGVFIILSGWALTQSTMRKSEKGALSWKEWYRARFVRLYPMYWVAHLLYLVSPFTARFEKVDGRFLLSLLGLRFIDITSTFFYLNSAWWYFTMLIQFYLIFPFLFDAARKLGPLTYFLLACAIGFFIRYLLLVVHPVNGMWIQGGFALCRLPEFALGMALALWDRSSSLQLERFLLRGPGLITGILLYPGALLLYHGLTAYTFVDFATGGCCFLVIVGLAGLIARFSLPAKVIATVGIYSYGLYLIHQPYVIWLGLRIREQPVWAFLLIALATLSVLSLWGALLEKATNSLVNYLAGKRTRPAFSTR